MSPCVFTSKPDKATRCTHAGDVVMRFCAPQGGCLLHLCAVRWRMGWAGDWFSSISKAFGPFLRFLILLCLSAVPLLTPLLFVSLAMCTTFSIFSPVYFFFLLSPSSSFFFFICIPLFFLFSISHSVPFFFSLPALNSSVFIVYPFCLPLTTYFSFLASRSHTHTHLHWRSVLLTIKAYLPLPFSQAGS